MDAAPLRSLSLSPTPPPSPIDADDRQAAPEALATLTAQAHGRCPGLSPEGLARHALRVAAGGDFSVARKALDALLRRVAAARRDPIRILERPAGRQVCGW